MPFVSLVCLLKPLIESTVMKYHFDSDDFLRLIKDGGIQYLDSERLETFLRVLPKQGEIMKLKEAIINEGCDTFEEASLLLKFGNVENFMVKFLLIENLELKVSLCLKMIQFMDLSTDLVMVSHLNNLKRYYRTCTIGCAYSLLSSLTASSKRSSSSLSFLRKS